jgi:phenylalanyl-tRNA synthetase beta chain
MKLHIRLLEKLIELPEWSVETASNCPLRHLLDDLGLEVKGVEASQEKGIVYTLETLANRGDHLSHVGVAREISARTLAQVKIPTLANQLSDRKASVPVRRATDKCFKYALMDMSVPAGMALRNDVASFVEDPEKLHPIVSILNYVQLEMGQPMHAFDADKIEGEIIVELSTKPEEIDALDGKRYTVPVGSVLIKDRKKIVAVAGVIGCLNSMVTGETRKVLIETAVFDPVSVRITARAMGVSTDSSYAFERGCDYEGMTPALKRVAYLAGGSAGTAKDTESAHVIGVTYAESAPTEKRKVTVLLSSLKKQLNLPRLEEVEVITRFKNLGYVVDSAPASGKDRELALSVPSWRLWDVRNADDVYEDIARSVSLNRVKAELPALDYEAPPLTAFERVAQNIRPALLGSGFVEVISSGFYSAADVAVLEQLSPGIGTQHLTLKNSLEAKNSHMKATNVVHMTKLLAANLKRGVGAAKVYELCRIFSRPAELPSDEPREREELEYDYEHDILAIASAGRWYEGEWRKPEGTADHARLFKGAIAGLIKGLGCRFSVGKGDSPLLHPGIQGSVKCGRHVVGVMGAVHPVIREACETRDEIFYCELDLRLLAKLMIGVPAPAVSDYPAVWRDMTLRLSPREQAGRVLRFVQEAALDSLVNAVIVDDFKKAEEDYRRVTYRITFQRNDRTLKSEEVDAALGGLVESLKSKHGIEMAN